MKFRFKHKNQINMVLALRSVAIVIQMILIFLVIHGFKYSLSYLPLFSIISVEIIFTCVCFWYFRNDKITTKSALFIQVLADVLFLSLLLYFSGGATNAFVSLLLIPIAISAVTLPLWMLTITALLAIASYSFMLWLMPMHVMHVNMQGHFIGMWVNFLFSTIVVALVVSKLARSINEKELAIAKYREDQLKQEKIIALGIASAQVTHQLATPLTSAQLLVDELKEEPLNGESQEIVDDLHQQLQRCSQSLHDFRTLTFDIKNQVAKPISTIKIMEDLQQYVQLNFPDITMTVTQISTTEQEPVVIADGALLPAIFNLINNGVRASKANNHNEIALSVRADKQGWQLTIRDYGQGFTAKKLTKLGVEPVDSDQGFGMAVFLSHASLERLGGKLTLTNHQEGGALVTLFLPIATGADIDRLQLANINE